MRLLRLDDSGRLVRDVFDPASIPPYAVLSHARMGISNEEVGFEDVETIKGREKAGYRKILSCATQAKRDSIDYFWVDTCCINQSDEIEMWDVIHMFGLYQNAQKCYAYLDDVSASLPDSCGMPCSWAASFLKSRWFTRGWTLQELLAPTSLEFFSEEWSYLGTRASLLPLIDQIIGCSRAGALKSSVEAENCEASVQKPCLLRSVSARLIQLRDLGFDRTVTQSSTNCDAETEQDTMLTKIRSDFFRLGKVISTCWHESLPPPTKMPAHRGDQISCDPVEFSTIVRGMGVPILLGVVGWTSLRMAYQYVQLRYAQMPGTCMSSSTRPRKRGPAPDTSSMFGTCSTDSSACNFPYFKREDRLIQVVPYLCLVHQMIVRATTMMKNELTRTQLEIRQRPPTWVFLMSCAAFFCCSLLLMSRAGHWRLSLLLAIFGTTGMSACLYFESGDRVPLELIYNYVPTAVLSAQVMSAVGGALHNEGK